MAGEHHNLFTEFPEFKEKIHELKTSNHHFLKLMNEHHEIDKKVRQAETENTVVCDENLEDLKKEHLKLRDELYQMLKNS